MRLTGLLAVAATAGIVIGIANSYLKLVSTREVFDLAELREELNRKPKKTPEEAKKKQPKLEVENGEQYDFGSMERFATMQHTFKIKNIGQAPLEIHSRRTTCKCTITHTTDTSCVPGKSLEVTLEWTGKAAEGAPEFRQVAELGTNDPDVPVLRLHIYGYVTETVRALPDELALGRGASNDGVSAEFRLFGFRSDSIEVNEFSWEEEDTARYFDFSFEPLPDQEVSQEKGATCGLLAKVAVKPGMPLGPINQRLRISLDVEKAAKVNIPIQGEVTSDILIASSRDFNSPKSLLRFGMIRQGEGAEAKLDVYVRGEHRQNVEFSIGEMKPAGYFDVTIGDPISLNNGKTIKRSVTIGVKKGVEPINCLGAELAPHGVIVLESTHPFTKQVPIHVKFAVE
jgi:hypothetical protein